MQRRGIRQDFDAAEFELTSVVEIGKDNGERQGGGDFNGQLQTMASWGSRKRNNVGAYREYLQRKEEYVEAEGRAG